MNQYTVYLLENDFATGVSITQFLTRQHILARHYSDPGTFLQDLENNIPNCLLLGLRIGDTDGITLAQQLASQDYCPPFIMVSEQACVAEVTAAMKSGAMDVLEKPIQLPQLLTRIEQAFDEDERRRNDRKARRSIRSRIQSLSSREREVLNLVMEGCLSKQIAKQLNISTKTVEAHRSNIVRKMHVCSFLQVVQIMAIEQTVQNDSSNNAAVNGLPSTLG